MGGSVVGTPAGRPGLDQVWSLVQIPVRIRPMVAYAACQGALSCSTSPGQCRRLGLTAPLCMPGNHAADNADFRLLHPSYRLSERVASASGSLYSTGNWFSDPVLISVWIRE